MQMTATTIASNGIEPQINTSTDPLRQDDPEYRTNQPRLPL